MQCGNPDYILLCVHASEGRGAEQPCKIFLEQLGKSEYNLWMLLAPHRMSLYLACASILISYPDSLLAAKGSELSLLSFSPIPQGVL